MVAIAKIQKAYKDELDGLFHQHTKQMAQMQESLNAKLAAAENRLVSAMDEGQEDHAADSSQAPQTDPQKIPAAQWAKIQGENLLVLNQAAAVQQIAILDRLAEILPELVKVIPRR